MFPSSSDTQKLSPFRGTMQESVFKWAEKMTLRMAAVIGNWCEGIRFFKPYKYININTGIRFCLLNVFNYIRAIVILETHTEESRRIMRSEAATVTGRSCASLLLDRNDTINTSKRSRQHTIRAAVCSSSLDAIEPAESIDRHLVTC